VPFVHLLALGRLGGLNVAAYTAAWVVVMVVLSG